MLETDNFRQSAILGTSLINQYRDGHIKTSDIYDISKLSTFLAITKLTGGSHGISGKTNGFI